MKGRGNCVRSLGQEHDFCQADKAENTDPHTNYAVKYATARGHLLIPDSLFAELLLTHANTPFLLPSFQTSSGYRLVKTFISCYRSLEPRKGFRGVSEGFQKGL